MPNNNLSRAAEISDVLREEILRGQYRPGERLPSERDLASRFAANRGAVREALKKLEQLGIAAIHPGGVRVVPIEEATLEVLGHILMINDIPDPVLVEQMFEVGGSLVAMSIRTAIEKASDDQLQHMRGIVGKILSTVTSANEQRALGKELSDYLLVVNGNLVLRLIGNGLKTQFMGHMEGLGDQIELNEVERTKILKQLDAAIAIRDAEGAARAAREHFNLIRDKVLELLDAMARDKASVGS
ncbi:MAG: GntR family transcriptional regulator [Gammaproteobacteria bacterium]|nr:GntR family transcriptional regulator [Gammaproteobacteria bacterium]